MKDVTCLIDRVSAVAYIPDLSYFSKSLELNPYVDAVYRSTRQGDYDMNIKCVDGSFIQINSREQRKENVRVDFNPNTIHGRDTVEEIQKIIAFMKHPRMTGIDFAVDYHGYDLSSLSISTPRSMKKAVYYAPSGKLESIALGSGNGDKRINFYDKGYKERQSLPQNHPHWWRVEIQRSRFKDENDYFINPYEGMTFTFSDTFPPDMKAADRLMLIGLQEQPELWNELGRKVKERLRDLQHQASKSLDPHPADVFELYKEEMRTQLQELFMPAYRNSILFKAL
ncbi:hypothetical protein AV545_23500 [Paenibacillus jamilae]|uniref:hypothetical protein n=1 Tax=Paenibacillus jamilae TaxID=114136 RepID=UPI0007AB9D16|nr:hypothetical protein [Paenibacillus jamilae]KZE67267.1 hypothetical protein AV545_23500 [Paenibacillus jamilae]